MVLSCQVEITIQYHHCIHKHHSFNNYLHKLSLLTLIQTHTYNNYHHNAVHHCYHLCHLGSHFFH